MTYVYLNYENMKKVTTSLAGYADKAEQARSDALTANSNNKNPGVLENMPTMAEKVHQLRDKTKEIDDRVELAKTQSENGATPKDSSGSIAYYVPDNMEDNIDNARSANQAIEDAKSLKEKKGRSCEGEVLDQIGQHNNNDAYSAAFVEHYGARETMKIAQNGKGVSDSKYKLAANLIARASTTWNKEKSQEISNSLVDYVKSGDRDGNGPELTFSYVLEAADVPYGKDFLVSLANGVEPLAHVQMPGPGGTSVGGHVIPEGGQSGGGRLFLLNSVLTAMRSRPEAALEYAVPDPNIDPQEAYKKINDKMKLGDLGSNQEIFKKWNDNWASIMAGNADKFGYEKVDEKHPASDDAKRSALLAAAGIDWFGATNDRFISPETRSNLASVLKCYAWSVDEAASSGDKDGDVPSPASPIDTDPSDEGADKASIGLTYQPQFHADNLAKVLGAISRDQDNFSSVTENVGELNANRMAYATAQAAKGDSGALQSAMNSSSAARGYLIGAGHAENEKDAANKDARNQAVIDTVMGLTSFIPGLPGTASFFENSAYSYAQNRGSAGIKDALQNNFTGNLNAAVAASSKYKAEEGGRIQIDLLCSLASGGALSKSQIEMLKKRVPNYFEGKQLTNDDIDRLSDAISNPNGVLTTEQQTSLNLAQGAYQQGYNITHKKK